MHTPLPNQPEHLKPHADAARVSAAPKRPEPAQPVSKPESASGPVHITE